MKIYWIVLAITAGIFVGGLIFLLSKVSLFGAVVLLILIGSTTATMVQYKRREE